MLGKPSTLREQSEGKQEPQHNFSSVQPSKHPLDLSTRNRYLSLNDLVPSPARSKMKESLREQSTDHGGRELRKLRVRVDQLESENMTLHKSIIEYEQEMKVWQDKATRLNEELIYYENKELAARSASPKHHHFALQFSQQEVQELKNTVTLLEEANRLQKMRIDELTNELQTSRRELAKSTEIELLFRRLQKDYQDAQFRLEREELKSKQNEDYVDELQKQIEYMSQEIPKKIHSIEKENTQIIEKRSITFAQQSRRMEKEGSELKQKLNELQLQKETIKKQNRQFRLEIEKMVEQKSKASTQKQDLYEELLKQRQKSYENNKIYEEKNSTSEKQLNAKIVSLNYENNTLKKENERFSETVYQKSMQIQALERKIQLLNVNSIKLSKIQQQKIVAKSQIFQQAHEKNFIYREEIKKLSLQNETMLKQVKQVESFYMLQVNNIKEESKKTIDVLSKTIDQIKLTNKKEKEQMLQTNQSNRVEVKSLQRIIHEQENQIQNIHDRYCAEVDKLMAENAQLRRSIEEAESYHLQERQQSQAKIKEYKEYTYAVSKLKGQIEQLNFQLAQQQEITAENQHQRTFYQRECEAAKTRVAQMASKLNSYQAEIQTLAIENERWKAYRLSEEDQARRETRKYKKKVEELEILLQKQAENNAITDLQKFQRTIETLKQEMLTQEIQSTRQLEAERFKLSQAMDEMTKEMHNILKECDAKINQKEIEIATLQAKTLQLTVINEELKNLQMKSFTNHQQADELNEKLQKELLTARNDSVRLQALLKKQQSEILAIKYSSEAQKQIRTRYDKDMENKVMQIQKLKLQTTELSDQLQRKNLTNKKQAQTFETSLKNKQNEVKESQQTINYLQNMIDSYKTENKRFKQMAEKEREEKSGLQNKIDQLSTQLASQSFKLNRLKDEKSQQILEYQCQAREWKEKWDFSTKQNRKLESKLAELNRNQQNKESELGQLQKQLMKSKSQLEDAKQKCEWLEERLNQTSRQGSQIKNIREFVAELQEKQANYQNTIDSQKQKIQTLLKDQGEKIREIQILLSKIDKLQGDFKKLLVKLEQQDRNKAKRIECYHNICNLHLTSSSSSRLTYDQDEELFLNIVFEFLKTFSSRLNQTIDELGRQKRLILELNEQKENLNGKYQKYKAVALDYKNRKQVQKELVRNNYRFNEEILHHCQTIIKGEPRR